MVLSTTYPVLVVHKLAIKFIFTISSVPGFFVNTKREIYSMKSRGWPFSNQVDLEQQDEIRLELWWVESLHWASWFKKGWSSFGGNKGKHDVSLVVLCNLHPQLLFYRKFNSGHFQTIHGAPFKASTRKYQQQQLEVWSTIFSKIFAMSNILDAFMDMGHGGYITVILIFISLAVSLAKHLLLSFLYPY